jgi:hypothetical protein
MTSPNVIPSEGRFVPEGCSQPHRAQEICDPTKEPSATVTRETFARCHDDTVSRRCGKVGLLRDRRYLCSCSYLRVTVSSSTRWAPNCWCKFGTEGGGTNTTVLFSSEGARTKEPLRRTTPSSTTASSTTTATTKQKLGKTTTAYYFGALHHLMPCPINYKDPPIYIGMG